MRGNESISSVDGTLSSGKRDRDQESAETLSEWRNFHAYFEQEAELAVQGKCVAQKRLSEAEAEAEMDKRNWDQRDADIVLHVTNLELESPRLELYQANQWTDKAQK